MTISSVLLGTANGITGGMITLFATRVTKKLGVGNTMELGLFSYGIVGFLIPLATTHISMATIFFVLPQIFGDSFWIMHDINKTSFQQTIIPENYLGRVIGAMKVSEKVATLIGVSIAGVVAEVVGLRVTLACGSVIWFAAGATYLHPAIRSIRVMSESKISSYSD
jgi:hypothetical protein